MTDDTFIYARQLSTSICHEQAIEDRPFVAGSRRIYGYAVDELAPAVSFVEGLVLLLTGELPLPHQARVLETAMVGVMNLGPRDGATRAAMIAGVSKTRPQHLLPVGLMAGGGQRQGAAEVSKAHHFIAHHQSLEAEDALEEYDLTKGFSPSGFGQRYSHKDPVMERLFVKVVEVNPHCPVLAWTQALHNALSNRDSGILDTGLIAAVCLSVGIGERESIGLYQIARAPGIFSQGVEQSHKPITAMPMLSDEEVELVRE